MIHPTISHHSFLSNNAPLFSRKKWQVVSSGSGGKKGTTKNREKDTTNEGQHQNNHKLFCDKSWIKLKGGFFLIYCKIFKSPEME
jgi:hypothetical protein